MGYIIYITISGLFLSIHVIDSLYANIKAKPAISLVYHYM